MPRAAHMRGVSNGYAVSFGYASDCHKCGAARSTWKHGVSTPKPPPPTSSANRDTVPAAEGVRAFQWHTVGHS